MDGRVTLTLEMVPDTWAAENSYGELVTRRHRSRGAASPYGNPYSYEGPMVETTTLRWFPGVDTERVLFHYLYGRPAPANRGAYVGSTWVEDPQWSYPRGAGKTRAEQKATALRLTSAAEERLAA